ncbi:hypothetical protein C2G38_2115955 [Gigaspora rosea]|uniref:Uncharacterized protein n=1 Tax=Gigaspora rosea TaxID=44941 RepID=A0A397UCJ9_9GLOM|nr:hypothetical protein C2G38_2115955 [Gigaspora rosea]
MKVYHRTEVWYLSINFPMAFSHSLEFYYYYYCYWKIIFMYHFHICIVLFQIFVLTVFSIMFPLMFPLFFFIIPL